MKRIGRGHRGQWSRMSKKDAHCTVAHLKNFPDNQIRRFLILRSLGFSPSVLEILATVQHLPSNNASHKGESVQQFDVLEKLVDMIIGGTSQIALSSQFMNGPDVIGKSLCGHSVKSMRNVPWP